MRLIPRETKFFDLFADMANNLTTGARQLRDLLSDYQDVSAMVQKIKGTEHKGDDIAHAVFVKLNSSFITPFDRGDIKELINQLDDAIDQMQKTAKSVILFEIDQFAPQMQEMGDIIVNSARLVQEAVPLLKNISSEAAHISNLTEKLSAFEGQADDVHDLGIRALFKASRDKNDLSFFTGHEVYDHLEKVVDRFDDVANVMHGIVIEHV